MPVYLVRRGADGPVKIGFSRNVQKRLASLQRTSPETMLLIREINAGSEMERALHKRFAELRLAREWFTFSDEMLGDLGIAEAVEVGHVAEAAYDGPDLLRFIEQVTDELTAFPNPWVREDAAKAHRKQRAKAVA